MMAVPTSTLSCYSCSARIRTRPLAAIHHHASSLPGRVYLGDRDLNVVSYDLPLAVLEYQTAVMRDDLETADEAMPRIPAQQRTRVAHFLEKRGTSLRKMREGTGVLGQSCVKTGSPFAN